MLQASPNPGLASGADTANKFRINGDWRLVTYFNIEETLKNLDPDYAADVRKYLTSDPILKIYTTTTSATIESCPSPTQKYLFCYDFNKEYSRERMKNDFVRSIFVRETDTKITLNDYGSYFSATTFEVFDDILINTFSSQISTTGMLLYRRVGSKIDEETPPTTSYTPIYRSVATQTFLRHKFDNNLPNFVFPLNGGIPYFANGRVSISQLPKKLPRGNANFSSMTNLNCIPNPPTYQEMPDSLGTNLNFPAKSNAPQIKNKQNRNSSHSIATRRTSLDSIFFDKIPNSKN